MINWHQKQKLVSDIQQSNYHETSKFIKNDESSNEQNQFLLVPYLTQDHHSSQIKIPQFHIIERIQDIKGNCLENMMSEGKNILTLLKHKVQNSFTNLMEMFNDEMEGEDDTQNQFIAMEFDNLQRIGGNRQFCEQASNNQEKHIIISFKQEDEQKQQQHKISNKYSIVQEQKINPQITNSQQYDKYQDKTIIKIQQNSKQQRRQYMEQIVKIIHNTLINKLSQYFQYLKNTSHQLQQAISNPFLSNLETQRAEHCLKKQNIQNNDDNFHYQQMAKTKTVFRLQFSKQDSKSSNSAVNNQNLNSPNMQDIRIFNNAESQAIQREQANFQVLLQNDNKQQTQNYQNQKQQTEKQQISQTKNRQKKVKQKIKQSDRYNTNDKKEGNQQFRQLSERIQHKIFNKIIFTESKAFLSQQKQKIFTSDLIINTNNTSHNNSRVLKLREEKEQRKKKLEYELAKINGELKIMHNNSTLASPKSNYVSRAKISDNEEAKAKALNFVKNLRIQKKSRNASKIGQFQSIQKNLNEHVIQLLKVRAQNSEEKKEKKKLQVLERMKLKQIRKMKEKNKIEVSQNFVLNMKSLSKEKLVKVNQTPQKMNHKQSSSRLTPQLSHRKKELSIKRSIITFKKLSQDLYEQALS